jgi:hypothetical protein
MRTECLRRTVLFGVAALLALPAGGQGRRPGPLPPPANGPPLVVIPAEPSPGPPPIPAAEIIKRFSENEDGMVRAHSSYTYRRVVQVLELDEQGKTTGQFQYTTRLAEMPDGHFADVEAKPPDSTLNVLDLDPEHVAVLSKIPPLPFTTTQMTHYDVAYEGAQKVDELNTYIFRVKPKQVERTRAYFDGVIWVDDQDFVIVKTTGHWVTELGDVSTENFPFTYFDTYRENVVGKIWFPAYLRSDGSVTSKKGTTRVRLVVRWEDYKPRDAASPTTQH